MAGVTPARMAVALAVAGIVLVAAWVGGRSFLQPRASYPGGLHFVGAASGALGVTYHRVYLWRAAGDTAPYPPLTLHLGGEALGIETLKAGDFSAYAQGGDSGAVYDSAGKLLEYRFEQGRLTWLSLTTVSAPTNAPRAAPGGNVIDGEIALSLRAGPPFTLPISRNALTESAGAPERTSWNLAN